MRGNVGDCGGEQNQKENEHDAEDQQQLSISGSCTTGKARKEVFQLTT